MKLTYISYQLVLKLSSSFTALLLMHYYGIKREEALELGYTTT